MQAWTTERVTALAPDAASASAGQSLASVRKWVSIGRSERAIWGLCQGSGKTPYQSRVDLSEPAFKCSCPSRKFPCKHGLGLLLLYALDASKFAPAEEPGWVAEWLAGRVERTEKKAERARTAADKPVDTDAQAKRAAQREARVRDGLAGCRVWLEDLARRGLAAARQESGAEWERAAARMVDAQAPGVAGLVRRIPEAIGSGHGWEVRTLDLLGRVHLLLLAGEGLAALPADLAAAVRGAIGWNTPKEDVLAGAGVEDRWVSIGQVVEEEDRLRVRRTWLLGRKTARRALVLDFAAAAQPLEVSVPGGIEFQGELAFYPGRSPVRALIKSRAEPSPIDYNLGSAADATIEDGLGRYAQALAASPWVRRWPMALAGVRVVREGEAWLLADSTNAGLPLRPSFAGSVPMWRLLSIGAGRPMTVLAEWDGEHALPVSAISAGGYFDLSPGWAA